MKTSVSSSWALLSIGLVCLLLAGMATGLAQDGPEVVDQALILLPVGGFIWEQPPISLDPRSETQSFCGWDEPAFAEEIPDAKDSAASRAVDDFRVIGPMPIEAIHWGVVQRMATADPAAARPGCLADHVLCRCAGWPSRSGHAWGRHTSTGDPTRPRCGGLGGRR
ncbi:MAG: hypothetical protein QHH07_07455 [Sedimentisphaerales bacterium]|nr:hypothetical protein [Sedimentisphaerales bacterium]